MFISLHPSKYVGAATLPPATYRIQLVRLNGTTPYTEQCSGVDPTPSSPARGWHRWMLRIRTSNEWPYGQWRQIAAATVGGYRISGDTIHLHRFNIQRGGRQVAAPTIHLFRITVFLTYLSSFCVRKISKTWYIAVGAAICRPPRLGYRAVSKNGIAFLRIRPLFPERFRSPRCLISLGCALPASPVGKLLYRALGLVVLPEHRCKGATSVPPKKLSIVNCPLSIQKNCQLSTVN